MTGRWKKALEKIWQEPEQEELTKVRQIGDSGSAGNVSFENLNGERLPEQSPGDYQSCGENALRRPRKKRAGRQRLEDRVWLKWSERDSEEAIKR